MVRWSAVWSPQSWGRASLLLCCHRSFDENQPHFTVIILEAEVLSFDSLSFSHMAKVIPQTCSSPLDVAFKRLDRVVLLAQSPLTVWTLWAVTGQKSGPGEWPTWQWHCFISDRGHGVRGERGALDTTKKQTLGHELPAELSLIGQTFSPVYVCSEGVGSPSQPQPRLQGWRLFTGFWLKLELLLWALTNRYM